MSTLINDSWNNFEGYEKLAIVVNVGAASLLVLGVVGTQLWNMIFRKDRFPVEGRTVVITGGSQGLGRSLGRILAEKGANVVIVARNAQKLEEAIQYVSAAARDPVKQRFHHISADVTQASENTRIIQEVTAWNNGKPPDIVWANAGVAFPTLLLDSNPETMQLMMNTNYFAGAYLAQATLRAWLHTGGTGDPKSTESASSDSPLHRHFITTSSTASFVGVAGYTPYSPCKSALRSLHDNLASELDMYNGAIAAAPSESALARTPQMKSHIVFPGTLLTPGLEEENREKHPVTKMLEEGDPRQTPDQAAAVAIRALEGGAAMPTTQGLLGRAMKAGSLQGSVRDSWVGDTIIGMVMMIVWIFVSIDLSSKARNFGKKNGMPVHSQ
ncbi:MAG: 3-dehydrosphinganine reductase [Chrysothrix sp. TS-e1954]|nr:MAG: 3-dehydrosphinganine reductase [Chrysothrix sp. TS-e1954]